MSSEPTHGDILAAIATLSAKQEAAHSDIRDIKIKLDGNTSRLAAIEKWIESHDAIVKFVKWVLAFVLAVGSLGLGAYKIFQKD